MINILALDLATKTGWASLFDGRRFLGSVVFDVRRGESPGMRFLQCRRFLCGLHESMGKIDLIIYEQAHHRGGYATQVGVGLVTEVLAFAADKEIETKPIHTATLKKWATGNGRASKNEMIKEAERRGYHPADDNEADASLLLEWAIGEFVK